jgi:hypothetical protein
MVWFLSTAWELASYCPHGRINSLARADRRLLELLRAVQEGKWSYIYGSTIKRDIVCTLAEELGHPPSWGDPVVLPAYGGRIADAAWKKLGVRGRNGVGGLPCNLVHGGVNARLGLDDSCVANAAQRAVYAFLKALVIYLPVGLNVVRVPSVAHVRLEFTRSISSHSSLLDPAPSSVSTAPSLHSYQPCVVHPSFRLSSLRSGFQPASRGRSS